MTDSIRQGAPGRARALIHRGFNREQKGAGDFRHRASARLKPSFQKRAAWKRCCLFGQRCRQWRWVAPGSGCYLVSLLIRGVEVSTVSPACWAAHYHSPSGLSLDCWRGRQWGALTPAHTLMQLRSLAAMRQPQGQLPRMPLPFTRPLSRGDRGPQACTGASSCWCCTGWESPTAHLEVYILQNLLNRQLGAWKEAEESTLLCSSKVLRSGRATAGGIGRQSVT